MKIGSDIRKKQEIRRIIYTIIIILLEIITLIADLFRHSNYFWKLNILLLASIILCMLFIFFRETDYMRKVMIRAFLLPLLLSASLTVPYIIWKVFFSSERLQMNTLAQVYVSYLSFASALILGYVVYINNVKKEERLLKKNAKKLCDNLDNLDMWLIRINYGENVETYKRDISWEKYYYEIYSEFGYDEKVIKIELDKIYSLVDRINREIECDNYDNVRQFYNQYIDSENKNTLAFNIFEVKQVLHSIAYPYSRPPKAWYLERKVQREISNYKEKYEKDVYTWIGTFFHVNCITECDRVIIEPLIYEWMMKKEEIKEWIKYPSDERKLVKMIDEIILNIRYKTNDLELCWGVILLKK